MKMEKKLPDRVKKNLLDLNYNKYLQYINNTFLHLYYSCFSWIYNKADKLHKSWSDDYGCYCFNNSHKCFTLFYAEIQMASKNDTQRNKRT